jgi:hypothetical protein
VRPRLIFVHVPKTAGRTFGSALRREYGEHYVFLRPGDPGVPIEDFVTWDRDRLAKVEAVGGHYAVGLDHLLPGESRYVTILRDPIDRILSFYSYIQTFATPEDEVFDLRVGMPLETWLTTSRHARDLQTQMIGGDLEHPEPADEHTLEQAIDRLDGGVFAAFGVQERFDETLAHIARTFGWRRPGYTSINVNPERRPVSAVDERTRSMIAAHNQLDLQLYRHVERRFDEILRAEPLRRRRLPSPARVWRTLTRPAARPRVPRT